MCRRRSSSRIEWAQIEGLIETEAPTGEREIEPSATSAADIREQEAILAAQGRTSFAAIALDPSGDIAAYTQLVHSSAESMVYQWGTLVRAEHRGHRLGAAVKAAAAGEFARSELAARAIITYNAEENEHMLAINRRLGFCAPPYRAARRDRTQPRRMRSASANAVSAAPSSR